MKYNLFERTIQKIDKILCKVETFVSVGCITLCGAILLFSIINRLWIKLPLRWTEEASRMLLILTVFSAQPIVTRESAHLKLAFLSEMLTGSKAAKILDFISDASVFAIFAVVFYLFSTYTISLTHYNQLSPAMGSICDSEPDAAGHAFSRSAGYLGQVFFKEKSVRSWR